MTVILEFGRACLWTVCRLTWTHLTSAGSANWISRSSAMCQSLCLKVGISSTVVHVLVPLSPFIVFCQIIFFCVGEHERYLAQIGMHTKPALQSQILRLLSMKKAIRKWVASCGFRSAEG
eukprot:m.35124 g.35124  ORF g.35124 m.35124 type:complete len:120 (-) comp43903_c0_seq2:238-597(-)